ncbi:MAG: hypothetical protein ACRYG8_19040 [Janthinobacterium lividum]
MSATARLFRPIGLCILPEVFAVAVADHHPGHTAARGAEDAVMHEMPADRTGRAVFKATARLCRCPTDR